MSIKNAKLVSANTAHHVYFSENGKRGEKGFCMSASALKAFDTCPRRWKDGWTAPDSDAKTRGNILDVRLLTPDQFDSRFAVQPAKYVTDGMRCEKCGSVTDSQKCAKCKCDRVKVNVEKDWSNQSTTCQEWVAEAERTGREVITAKDVMEADTAIARLKADETIASFLDCSLRQVMFQAEWHDPGTGLIIPLRCLIDLYPDIESEFGSNVGDLKRVWNANPGSWMFDCEKMGHHLSGALYLDMSNAAFTDEHRDTACFIASESFAPWQPSRMFLKSDFIELGRMEYRRMLANYCWCMVNNRWPDYNHGGPQGWTELTPTQKMVDKAVNKPKFDTETSAPIAAPVEVLFDTVP